ncbi:OLC1v1003807C1 [Oldenlandia corymbosa var. corymbosa]|uniref:OLC1v1003807C1 n=1 Tax=Oldenlandia corymbosa var. corymbosa TaxID=529605 RepID=A0AAV1DAU9_OLDCO|nr:OLC1v1003807C1 [Oldenlandia corymbosa var. corymbosa]
MPRNGTKTNGYKKKMNLKGVVEKLQKSLSLGKKPSFSSSSSSASSACHEYIDHHHRDDDELEFEEVNDSTDVPDDVKEGHFAVIACDGYEFKRFVVPLSYLTHPTFLRLLEMAAEEYGFDREGALMIPCRPSELERILMEETSSSSSSPSSSSRSRVDDYQTNWSSSRTTTRTMVTSC